MKTRPNIQIPTLAHRKLLLATAGKAARLRRSTDAHAELVANSHLPGVLGYLYADTLTAGTLWNAFHSKMAEHDVPPCAPYAVALRRAWYCFQPAICPSCMARQGAQLLDVLKANKTKRIVATRIIARSMDVAGVTHMCSTARQLLARSRSKTSALLLRVYPRADEDIPVVGAVLVSGDGNPDVFMDGAFGLRPRVFDTTQDGVAEFINAYAAYPEQLLRLDPADVRRAYALLRGFRSSISRKKVNAKIAYYQWDGHSGRLASDFPDLENAPGSTGGLVSQPDGRSDALHPEPAVVAAGR